MSRFSSTRWSLSRFWSWWAVRSLSVVSRHKRSISVSVFVDNCCSKEHFTFFALLLFVLHWFFVAEKMCCETRESLRSDAGFLPGQNGTRRGKAKRRVAGSHHAPIEPPRDPNRSAHFSFSFTGRSTTASSQPARNNPLTELYLLSSPASCARFPIHKHFVSPLIKLLHVSSFTACFLWRFFLMANLFWFGFRTGMNNKGWEWFLIVWQGLQFGRFFLVMLWSANSNFGFCRYRFWLC